MGNRFAGMIPTVTVIEDSFFGGKLRN